MGCLLFVAPVVRSAFERLSHVYVREYPISISKIQKSRQLVHDEPQHLGTPRDIIRLFEHTQLFIEVPLAAILPNAAEKALQAVRTASVAVVIGY